MTEAELQFYLQLAAAAAGGLLLGVLLGGLFRLRKTGQLQQSLEHTETRLEETRAELADASGERNALRNAEQAASLQAGVLETELRSAKQRFEEKLFFKPKKLNQFGKLLKAHSFRFPHSVALVKGSLVHRLLLQGSNRPLGSWGWPLSSPSQWSIASHPKAALEGGSEIIF